MRAPPYGNRVIVTVFDLLSMVRFDIGDNLAAEAWGKKLKAEEQKLPD